MISTLPTLSSVSQEIIYGASPQASMPDRKRLRPSHLAAN